jgi:hypothetical protein
MASVGTYCTAKYADTLESTNNMKRNVEAKVSNYKHRRVFTAQFMNEKAARRPALGLQLFNKQLTSTPCAQ